MELAWLRTGVIAALLVGLLLLPLWMVRYPPLLDYPNHLASAFVIAHLHDPHYQFDRWYSVQWRPYPYLLMEVILLGLQRLVPIVLAGRILLSLCVLAVPLGVWAFLHESNPGEEHLAVWGLLLAYNPFFLFGFLNYQLSIALCFLVLALWMRYLARPGLGLWCLLVLGVTLLYFTHFGGFVIAGLAITVHGLLARLSLRRLLLSWLSFLPGAMFYLSTAGDNPTFGVLGSSHTLGEKLVSLITPVNGYSATLDLITCLVMAGAVLLALHGNPEFRWNLPWLGVAIALFLLYWVTPSRLGGGEADRRILPFLFVSVLAAVKLGRRGKWLVPVALLLFLVRTANVAYNFVSEQPRLQTLARSFSVIPENARILPVVESRGDSYFRMAYDHFWCYGVIEKGWLSPYLFARPGIHVLRMDDHVYQPEGFRTFLYEKPPDWSRVQQDFDYVWAYNVPRFDADLRATGELVFDSGGLRVFREKRKAGGP